MSEGGAVRSIADALEQVSAWRAEQEARCQAEVAEVEQEVASLRQAIDELEQQVGALLKFREELDERQQGLEGKTYEAVFEVMAEQSRALAARAALLAEVASERDAGGAGGEDVEGLLAEYRSFKAKVEPALQGLPESYRGVLQAHHDHVVARLRDHFEKASPGPPELPDAEMLPLDVLFAVDAPDGAAELLMFVLPVGEETHAEWEPRGDGLELAVAARCVAACYRVLAEIGQGELVALYGGHRGLIAVEVELDPCEPEQVVAEVFACFEEMAEGAPELEAARVRVAPHQVGVDDLFPPDDTSEEEGETEIVGVTGAR